jgi:hypothetical protein
MNPGPGQARADRERYQGTEQGGERKGRFLREKKKNTKWING